MRFVHWWEGGEGVRVEFLSQSLFKMFRTFALLFTQDKGQQSANVKCHSPPVNEDSLHRQESATKQTSSQITCVSCSLLKTIYAFLKENTKVPTEAILAVQNQCALYHWLKFLLQGLTFQHALVYNLNTLVLVYWDVMVIAIWTRKQHHAGVPKPPT